jgi:hypothetical protein
MLDLQRTKWAEAPTKLAILSSKPQKKVKTPLMSERITLKNAWMTAKNDWKMP